MFPDDYYWARHREDGTMFIVLREAGDWYCVGVELPITEKFSETDVICPVKRPEN